MDTAGGLGVVPAVQGISYWPSSSSVPPLAALPHSKVATAHSTLATALTAAKAAMAAALERD